MRRMSIPVLRGVAIAVAWLTPFAASAAVQPPGLEEALQRVATVAQAPASKQAAEALWGLPLDAPVVLHDRVTGTSWRRNVATGDVESVVLRKDQPPANTCIDIDGASNVLLILPLPADNDGLATLFWHEQWHCVQAMLGLSASEGDTAHLDGELGRIALRLEMRALAKALSATDDRDARPHVAAALRFRALRSAGSTSGTRVLDEEARVERNEGLAEYTGRRVAAAANGGNMVTALVKSLAAADASPSFVRSAAYVTGPAYGMLLDRWSPHWRSGLSPASDLPALLAEQLGTPLSATGADGVGRRYGVDEVRAQEHERARIREQRSAGYRKRYLGGDAVRLTLSKPSASFDPHALFPLDEVGTVYTPLMVRDEWGELTAESGALMSKDWTLVTLSGGEVTGSASNWTGPGWTLVLNAGWRLEKESEGWRLTNVQGGDDHR